jgi:hypothetical protein
MEQQSGGISNGDLRTRLGQMVALLIAILIGILISSSVGAQDQFHRAKEKHFKTRYKTQIRQADNACNILNRKPKYKPQAEIDTPSARN